MSTMRTGDVEIYFEDQGDGYPVLLFAPGGMDSDIAKWERAAVNPLKELAGGFRTIAVDQRHAGRSSGPLETDDPWGAYGRDHIALLDHLGIEKCHLFGCCIGASFALWLMEHVPDRIASAVLEQPIGITETNRKLYQEAGRSWGEGFAERTQQADTTAAVAFGTATLTGEFVLSTSRDFVRSCATPMLVLPGIDEYHPGVIGREIAGLAPDAKLVDPWKETPELAARASEEVRTFLKSHS